MKNNKSALVLGAGGFIGSHMVTRLKKEGYTVIGSDLKKPEYSSTTADEFMQGDLRDPNFVSTIFNKIENTYIESFTEIYQFAADMGGAGYIFTGTNDAEMMTSSVQININILQALAGLNKTYDKSIKIFYSSSACIYPEHNQLDPNNPDCSEDSAYPANPDSEYGWEKLFSERLYFTFNKNYGTPVRVARYHNIFGPEGSWSDGREKAPAAICRKVAEAKDGTSIKIWGDGNQTRSFLYIDECLEGVRRLMESKFINPVNIGSDEMVSINHLAKLTMKIAKKNLTIDHIDGPLGVRGRNSDNKLILKELGWSPNWPLDKGLAITYKWILNKYSEANN